MEAGEGRLWVERYDLLLSSFWLLYTLLLFFYFFLSSRFLICVMVRRGKDPPKTSQTLFRPFQDHSQAYEGWEKEMEKQRTDLWLRWFSFSSHDRYFLSLNFFIVWLISISLFLLFIILRYRFHKTGSEPLNMFDESFDSRLGISPIPNSLKF